MRFWWARPVDLSSWTVNRQVRGRKGGRYCLIESHEKPMLAVPYQFQRDNAGGNGWRECFSSSVAMLCMFHGRIRSDDAYISLRRPHGDTTDASAHLRTVRGLGLLPTFSQTWGRPTLEASIRAGVPVAVGWLHHGTAAKPTGGGHWSVVIGTNARGPIMHDPYGEPDLVNGGHIIHRTGRAVQCSWQNWLPRWTVEGPGSGWVFTVRK